MRFKHKNSKACIREVIGMDDRIVMLIGIPVMGFFIPLLFFGATFEDGLMAYLPKALMATLFASAYWITVRSIIIYYRRKYPYYKQMGKRTISSILLVIPFYIAICSSMNYVKKFFGLDKTEIEGVTQWDYNVMSIMLIIMVAAIYESVWLYTRWKESIVEQEKLRREYVQSQLEGLRSQVNPHFLFNSLNTLSYLIPEDSERAVKFVQKLSKVYRYILEIKDKKIVSLKEELDFLESYIFLLKERFGNNLMIKVDIDKDQQNLHLIPLSLQLLFENAIKHNIISKEYPLEVTLWVDADKLLVRNNLQRKTQEMPSTNVGLENVRHRYSFYTQRELEVIETKEFFLVALPLLKNPVIA